jgi:UDP-glucuronate 4-epimerase
MEEFARRNGVVATLQSGTGTFGLPRRSCTASSGNCKLGIDSASDARQFCPMTILVTGAAGFVGYHTTRRLLELGHEVVGVDNLNPYYDVGLKQARLERLRNHPMFRFFQLELGDSAAVSRLFETEAIDRVVHLAAQAGVRHSISHPLSYAESNLVAFLAILEGCRRAQVKHFVFASSSSVYGLNRQMPFAESHGTDHPVSLYAATKKANEVMAHSYSHLYDLPTTGLRFFTVYGPWGRPDMAYFSFTKAILEGRPITVFNNGAMERDFTYIDDIVSSIERLLWAAPTRQPGWDLYNPDPGTSSAPYRILNLGNSAPVPLLEMIQALERSLGKQALLDFQPMQPGDVTSTSADTSRLSAITGPIPSTGIQQGLDAFVAWYREYYKIPR